MKNAAADNERFGASAGVSPYQKKCNFAAKLLAPNNR